MYGMSTIENHSFENESEINYVVKWFKAHNLVLTDEHTLTCLILPKTMSNELSMIAYCTSRLYDWGVFKTDN